MVHNPNMGGILGCGTPTHPHLNALHLWLTILAAGPRSQWTTVVPELNASILVDEEGCVPAQASCVKLVLLVGPRLLPRAMMCCADGVVGVPDGCHSPAPPVVDPVLLQVRCGVVCVQVWCVW